MNKYKSLLIALVLPIFMLVIGLPAFADDNESNNDSSQSEAAKKAAEAKREAAKQAAEAKREAAKQAAEEKREVAKNELEQKKEKLKEDKLKICQGREDHISSSMTGAASRGEEKIALFSKEVRELKKPLRGLLMEKLYHHYRVIRMSDKAKRFIQEIFKLYLAKPKALPEHIQNNIARFGKVRVVCDYIAGMTDRYALDEYKKLFDPYAKV